MVATAKVRIDDFNLSTRNRWFSIVLVNSNHISRKGLSWAGSYGSWILNYICNQWLSPLKLCVRMPLMARCTRYNIMWLTAGQWHWFSPGTPVSSINKTDLHDITEILFKVVLKTKTLTTYQGNHDMTVCLYIDILWHFCKCHRNLECKANIMFICELNYECISYIWQQLLI